MNSSRAFQMAKRAFMLASAFTLVRLIIVAVTLHISQPPPLSATERPPTWAAKIDKAGLQNFYSVSTNFYRGAQPTKEGMAALQQLGIKTVIDLRAFHSDTDKIGKLTLESERFHLKTWHAEDEDVIRFLKIVTDTNRWPVFVHCQHGSDRTGLMCAMYRMAVQGWTREQAIEEMTRGGYGFHPEWQNLIHYLRKVDVDRIRRAAGISGPASPAQRGSVEDPPQTPTKQVSSSLSVENS